MTVHLGWIPPVRSPVISRKLFPRRSQNDSTTVASQASHPRARRRSRTRWGAGQRPRRCSISSIRDWSAATQEVDELLVLGRGHGPCLSQVPALFKGSGCRAGERGIDLGEPGSSREEHREDLSARRRHDSPASRPENPARLAMPDRYGDDFPESIRHGIRVVKLDLIPPRH